MVKSKKTKLKLKLKNKPNLKLPNKIIPIECSDKENFTEAWSPGRNLLNIPHPFRSCFTGPPSSGKSTAIKNIIIRAKPEFEEILVVHLDFEGTTEWDDCDAEMLDQIPEPTDFDRETKRLLIIEDLNLSDLPKDDKNKLNRLFGYTSSHCNLSIAITCQNAFDMNASLRRMCSLFVIFKQPDVNALITLASRTGLKSQHMLYIMSRLLKNQHDSLWIDMKSNSPAPYRINGFNTITLEQLDNSIN